MRDLFVPDTFRDSINGVMEKKNINHVVRVEALWHPLFVDNPWQIDSDIRWPVVAIDSSKNARPYRLNCRAVYRECRLK